MSSSLTRWPSQVWQLRYNTYLILFELMQISVWGHGAQRSKHQQFWEQVSLSLTLILSWLSVSPSLSQSPSPSLGRPGLLCPSSSFYFMPRPSVARSSSITTRTLHRLPPHTPHPGIKPGQIQILPSLGLTADTLLCDSSLHWTPFGIHHITTSLSPPGWDASEKTVSRISRISFHNYVRPLCQNTS